MGHIKRFFDYTYDALRANHGVKKEHTPDRHSPTTGNYSSRPATTLADPYGVYMSYPLICSAVNNLSQDSCRLGFTVNILGEDLEKNQEISAWLYGRLEELRFNFYLSEASKFSMIYRGGSMMIPHIENVKGRSVTSESSLKSVFYRVSSVGIKYGDIVLLPPKEGYNKGFPYENYLVSSAGVVPTADMRMWVPYDINTKDLIAYSLVDFLANHQTLFAELFDASSRGLAREGLMKYKKKDKYLNSSTALRQAKETAELIRDDAGVAVVGTEEDFDYVSASGTGVSATLANGNSLSVDWISAITGVPKIILLGRGQSGSMVTGEGNAIEIQRYYERIENYQNTRLLPSIRTMISLLLREQEIHRRYGDYLDATV